MKEKQKIILASSSPRRKEIAALFFDVFEVVAPEVDETVEKTLSPEQVVLTLAERKARAAANTKGDADAVYIGSDTIVYANGTVLGKPENRPSAKDMLHMLSGNTHSVYSGVCVLWQGKAYTGYEETRVIMRHISEEELDAYVATGECDDKAGAYAIQGRAGLFIERIEGPYHNVVGLPLKTLGLIWRDLFGSLV
ncbi:MAG: septum formation protein Maf [Clostridiales bacterium]|nr:septum formation protein Maf [Clostridiales bacterium]